MSSAISRVANDFSTWDYEDMIPLQYVKWDAFLMVIWSQFRLWHYRDVGHRKDLTRDKINRFSLVYRSWLDGQI